MKPPRPRDAAGRPLPYGQPGVPPVPEDPNLTPAQVLALADDYLAAGRPFAAHEVLETAWKNRPDAERDLWQGLAQVAVGLTHLQRGNETGAVALLRRGVEHLARAADGVTECDARRIAAEASKVADLVARQDPISAQRAADIRLLD
jgi:predicted metal-dependent hydrolase